MLKEKLQPSFDVGETEFNQHEKMQQDDLQSESSFLSYSQRCIASIVGETFEIDYNEYQNVSSCDGLDSDTDDGDGDYEYEKDNDDERFNRIIINTNGNIDSKESSLLSYTTSVYSISDEEEDDEDSLIEIHLQKGNFSNLADESTQKIESELLDFLSESIFMQQNLMELLSETNDMNEDENLIEIDISM
ncbi:uncharacterized protein LOC131642989 [Vicia villosa]|uniref:uncharacterized protein LOC131642989 n=1 Tax=Vicia villosa TaxID=3911 RepID=UPI00273B8C99|nr:uncharacterized protein LOC131642989 [Vicia villosa]